TSIATPFVTGTAALYLSQFPGATSARVRAAILDNAITGVPKAGNKLVHAVWGTPPGYRV
ncbi:hypothetical protein SARC_16092, partial [Sphaeroforma arctica JP610]